MNMPVPKDTKLIFNKTPILTQGAKKMFSSFYELSMSEAFNKKIAEIQKEFDLPLLDIGEEGEVLQQDHESWRKNLGGKRYSAFKKDVQSLADEYGYYSSPENLDPFIEFVLFAGESGIDLDGCKWDVLMATDRTNAKLIKDTLNKRHVSHYPVCLYLSPYATANDIRDYIKKNYIKEIQPILDRHKKTASKIGKIRSKNPDTAQRNRLLYVYRNKGRDWALKAFGDQFDNFPDEGNYGKIISEEKKRRR